MNDVIVLKAAYNVNDGIDLTDICKELVTEALALGSASYQTCDINKFKCGRGKLIGVVHFPELVKTAVGNGNYAHVGLDGAERIVCRFCACICKSVEERTFSYVRKTDHT